MRMAKYSLLIAWRPLVRCGYLPPMTSINLKSRPSLMGYTKRHFSASPINRNNILSSPWRQTDLSSTRSVVRVAGKDSLAFLQGLITNDIHLLDASDDGGPRSIYTLMLNLQGRVVFDLFISPDSSHHTGEGYLVDCDARMSDRLVKHLKMFKLRKDVAVELAADRKVHAMFKESWKDGEDGTSGKSINQSNVAGLKGMSQSINQSSIEDLYGVQDNSVNQSSIDTHAGITRDPRLGLLGYRSIVTSLKQTDFGSSSLADEMEYRKFRYQLGVPEGSLELPPGECLPLESNADYLSGVHFHKGCYLGQELTARTHHTGVVRKRLMPIVIEGLPSGATLERDSAITVPGAPKSVGKVRAHLAEYGLALLRISEALAAADGLEVSWEGKRFAVRTEKPRWWPEPD